MVSSFETKQGRAFALLAGVFMSLLIALGVPAPALAEVVPVFSSPGGTRAVWIDVEADGLEPGQIVGRLRSGTMVTDLDFAISPTGVTARLSDVPKEFTLEFTAQDNEAARVSVTFADADNTVIGGSSTMTVIKKNTSTVVSPNTTGEKIRAVSGTGGTQGASLADTGAPYVTGILFVVALCLAGGALLLVRRRNGATL